MRPQIAVLSPLFGAYLGLFGLLAIQSAHGVDRKRESEGIPKVSAQPPEVLRSTIDSLEQLRSGLRQKNKRGAPTGEAIQQQVTITLQQASLLMSLGQALLVSAKDKKEKAEGDSALSRSITLLNGLLRDTVISKRLSEQQMGALFRMRGASHFYRNNYAAALKDFENSLKYDLNSPDSVWTAFMAAEEQFEQSNFKRASELYLLVKSRSTVASKPAELSQYKHTWCLINMGQLGLAEASFLDLASKARDEQLGLDSARDLAFVVSSTQNEAQILALFESKLSVSGERGLAFLKKALSTLEAQGKVGAKSPLRDRVLTLEKDPAARVTIHLESIQGVAKEYASLAHAQRVLKVLAAVNEIPEDKREPLEASGERICKTFSETYAGRAKTPEKIDKQILGKTLRELLSSQMQAFPKGKRKPQLYGILLDVCELERDADCLVSISRKMILDPVLEGPANKAVFLRAKDAEILGLETLSNAPNGAQYRAEFKKALIERVNDAEATNGVLAGAKLAQLEVEDQAFEPAKKALIAVLKLKPTHEYWYSFKWAQLKSGDFEGVLRGPETLEIKELTGAPDPRLNSVLSEASIQLAAKARAEGNLEQMAVHIKKFETLSSDPEKVNLARDEWVRSLIDKKLYMEASAKILELPDLWHNRKAADDFKLTIVSDAVESSKLEWIGDWFWKWRARKQPRSDFGSVLLTKLYLQGPKSVSVDQVYALSEGQRSVWLSSAVLSEPAWAYGYFRRYPPKGGAEQSMDALAHRFLGKAHPLGLQETRRTSAPLTEFELAAARVSFPAPVTKVTKKALDRYTMGLQSAIQSVSTLREKLLPSLKGQVAEVQIRIIKAQREIERKAASGILRSPLPAGLNPAQSKQYREGLKQLAAEYEKQVVELDATQAKIQAKVAEIKKKTEEEEKLKRLMPLSNPDSLIEGVSQKEDDPTRQVFALAGHSNSWGALLELERLRAKKLIDEALYWRLRSWSLVRRGQGPVLLKYLFDELSDAGQSGLLEEWKKEQEHRE